MEYLYNLFLNGKMVNFAAILQKNIKKRNLFLVLKLKDQIKIQKIEQKDEKN